MCILGLNVLGYVFPAFNSLMHMVYVNSTKLYSKYITIQIVLKHIHVFKSNL